MCYDRCTVSDVVIETTGVGKRFRLQQGRTGTLKGFMVDRLLRRGNPDAFWALRDVSFCVKQGEVLGIIGANGAGKSTLLSILAGTMFPTVGAVRTAGAISSLLELGAGFHPDLTGRENVYLYGATMGLTRAAMMRRMDAIIEFAGLRIFIDQPVKHYSSGMYVRLGFAVAVEVDPDILLIDEVLAVGDAVFQRKCLKQMAEFRARGKTMLIISHDLHAIQAISTRIIFLDHGRIMGDGDPARVVGDYETLMQSRGSSDLRREWGSREAELSAIELRDESGSPATHFRAGGRLSAIIRYRAASRIEAPVFGYAIADPQGRVICGDNTQIEQAYIPFIEGNGEIILDIDQLPLAAGNYLMSFSLHSADHSVNYHRLDHAFPVVISGGKQVDGCCYIPCRWSMRTGGGPH